MIPAEAVAPAPVVEQGRLLPPWRAEPYRLWSLLAMLAAYAKAFLDLELNLGRISNALYVLRQSYPPGARAAASEYQELTSAVFNHYQTIRRCLNGVRTACLQLDLKDNLKQIDRLSGYLDGVPANYESAREIETRLRTLSEALSDALESRMLLYVARPDLYNQTDYFGEDVGTRFERANYHVRESATCLAVARPTAAVHHSMCVLDVGLDSLSDALGLKYSRKNWGYILKEIKTAIEKLKDEDTEDRDFYSEAAIYFRYFKDVWRNHTQHGRAKYDLEEAERIVGHVKDFMAHLATRLRQRPEPEELPEPEG